MSEWLLGTGETWCLVMIWRRNDHIDKQVLTKKKQGKRVWQRDLSNNLFVSLSEAGVCWFLTGACQDTEIELKSLILAQIER